MRILEQQSHPLVGIDNAGSNKTELIARIAPDNVAWCELEDTGQKIPLHPQEAGYVAGSAERRRREFSLGRYCARDALGKSGLDNVVIPRAAGGAPIWPAGFVGSITHTEGYAAALAAQQSRYLAVGLDAERVGGVTDKLLPLLFGADERAMLEAFESSQRLLLATVCFSAKEACYKAWSAMTGKSLSLPDIRVALVAGGFAATAPVPQGWRTALAGRYAVNGNLVVTAVCIAAIDMAKPGLRLDGAFRFRPVRAPAPSAAPNDHQRPARWGIPPDP